MAESVADPRIPEALAETQRLVDAGLLRLFPSDYVYLMDDPESGDEGQRIAYVAADGTLVPC